MSYDRQCSSCGGFCGRGGCKRENVKPPARKPLTDEQLRKLARDAGIKLMNDEALALGYLPAAIKKFARAIERAHGIGE